MSKDNTYTRSIDAVKRAVDIYFSELIPENKKEGIVYVGSKVDSKDKDSLERLADKKLKSFLPQHPDNTLELFKEIEIENAKRRQSFFTKYKTDPLHKTYFYHLDRWIEFLTNYIEPSSRELRARYDVDDFTAPPGSIDQIRNFHPIRLRGEQKVKKKGKVKPKDGRTIFSHLEIALAYDLRGKSIMENHTDKEVDAKTILNKYSDNESIEKLMAAVRQVKLSRYKTLPKKCNKGSYTKRVTVFNNAEMLMNGIINSNRSLEESQARLIRIRNEFHLKYDARFNDEG